MNRRAFLRNSLVVGGAAATLTSIEERVLAAEIKNEPAARSTLPAVEALQLPRGKIGNLEISRMICGGNLIGGWAHSRDLIYVSKLVKAYHTDEKVFETLRLVERRGVNTLLTNASAGRVINDYWYAEGGKIQWISDCHSMDQIKSAINDGAHAVYLNGGQCDKLVRENKLTALTEILKFMQTLSVPCGLGAHDLETVKACESAGLQPMFWVKTLHQDNYWSATPQKNRGSVGFGRSDDHDMPHDNMFCTNAPETIRYMASLKRPWIAFKILAAGAIHPREAIGWAFQSGADFACVGMFDFQVVENTGIAAQALAAVAEKGRARPWMA